MPVVPQYNAGVPAGPGRPALERERIPRVNLGESMNALGNLANEYANSNAPLSRLDPDAAQARARGLQQAGQGLERLGEVMYHVRESQQRAQIAIDIEQGQTALEEEWGRFQQWQAQNPNPQGWEGQWTEQFQTFSNRYFEGKEVSPEAKQAIAANFDTYGRRKAVDVGVGAAKETNRLAGEAILANVERAVKAKDLDTVTALSEHGWREGHWGEDDAVRMVLQSEDKIKADQLEDFGNLLNADRLNGNFQSAIERTRGAIETGLLSESEGIEQVASLQREEKYEGVIEEIRQDSALDLAGTRERLAKQDKNGTYTYYKSITLADRKKAIANLDKQIALENKEAVGELLLDYSRGTVDAQTVQEDERFKGLPDEYQGLTLTRIREDALNDFMELGDFRDKVWSDLDPRSEDAERQRAQLESEAALRFDGELLESSMQAIEERFENPDPFKVDEYARSRARSYWGDRFKQEDFGRFKYGRGEIEEVEKVDSENKKTGEKVFAVRDDNPPEGFGFKSKQYIFGIGGNTYREIKLTPEQEKAWRAEDEKEEYVDQHYYRAAGEKLWRAFEEVGRKEEAGEVQAIEDYNSALGDLLGLDKAESFDAARQRVISEKEEIKGVPSSGGFYGPSVNSLFPDGSAAKALREKYPNL